MAELTPDRFAEFYEAINHHEPYPWQNKLAKQVIETGKWPDSIDIPTGCGKTSCIDIAVYALACKPENNPRRIMYVVNRRTIVDEGNEHAKEIAKRLENKKDETSILADVRNSLCKISGGDTALKHTVLRGGTYLDNDWTDNPIQACVISSTIDQAGSRLLFRGYGVGQKSKAVHAGLLGYDCLWILDETHISKPFTKTLRMVEKFRKAPWIKNELPIRPWAIVEMSATPTGNSKETFQLSNEDYVHDHIKCKLEASKRCKLKESKAKSSDDDKQLALDIKKFALQLYKDHKFTSIGIVVNRVKTAKLVYEELKKENYKTHLMIGRMRPWDRDKLWDNLSYLKTSMSKDDTTCSADAKNNNLHEDAKVTFVVATQCLEVGVDLDFEGMVTEIASLDSLIQRFGRLNRSGKRENSNGIIVVPQSVKSKKVEDDPIYGDAVNKTWEFLKNIEELDFGILKFKEIVKKYDNLQELVMQSQEFPVLLPSHMDLLCQTHPRLHKDPNIAPFLHGFERGSPMVSVVWRAGWNDDWELQMSYLPPKTMEAIQVPIWDIQKYLKQDSETCTGGDAEWQQIKDFNRNNKNTSHLRKARRWDGKKSQDINDINDIKPGNVIILPAEEKGWSELGHIPIEEEPVTEVSVDIAEKVAFTPKKGSSTIRMGDNFPTKMTAEANELIHSIKHQYSKDDIKKREKDVWESLQHTATWKSLESISKKYNEDYFTNVNLVYNIKCSDDYKTLLIKFWHKPETKQKDADNESQFLDGHTKKVKKIVEDYAKKLNMSDDLVDIFVQIAKVHDIGKADERFQKMLYRSTITPKKLRAKDDGTKPKPKEHKYYPDGFRHEFISSELVSSLNKTFDNDLFLHIVESHHGYCRPFVPVVFDEENSIIEYELDGNLLKTHAATGIECVGSGAAKRFWKCVRKYGWWGCAYLEAIFILADWKASRGAT